jgi:DNA-binding Xre family transcriptional regulator
MTCRFKSGLVLLMEEQEVSSTELASRLNVSINQISRWRKTNNLKLNVIHEICIALDITAEEFLSAVRKSREQAKNR